MNAQQQLAELNARQCKTLTDEADLRHDRARWIRDHGPAIAELISESARRPKYNFDSSCYEVSGIELQFKSLLEAEKFILERIRSAAEKLTGPK